MEVLTKKENNIPGKIINSKDLNYELELEIKNSKLCIKAVAKSKL